MLKDLSENDLKHLKIWVQGEHRQRSILLVYSNEPHTVEKKLIISLSYFYDRLLAVVTASLVSATLCVRIMSAPFKIQTVSAVNDPAMPGIIERYSPSLILCAYNKKAITGNQIQAAKQLLKKSLDIAKSVKIPSSKIVLDPAIGFFREKGKNSFFTKNPFQLAGKKSLIQFIPLKKRVLILLILVVCPPRHIYQQWYRKKPRWIVLLKQFR